MPCPYFRAANALSPLLRICLASLPSGTSNRNENGPLRSNRGGPFLQAEERSGNLIFAGNQVVRKYAFEPALFVLVVQQDHGSNPQRMPARVACCHFSLQVLQETIGKMILVGSTSRRFFAALAAIWTGIFQSILLRITAQRRPSRITDPNSLFRRKTHDFVPHP